MSIIHVLGYFYKLEKKRKIIKEERERAWAQKEKQSGKAYEEKKRNIHYSSGKLCQKKLLTKGHSINEPLLAAMMYIISFYIILSIDIHSNSCR